MSRQTFWVAFLIVWGTQSAEAVATPSQEQLELIHYPFGLSMFAHFGIETFAGINACARKCPPPTHFAPVTGQVNTTQWLETAVELGASEVCVTAHHGAGFALWRSNETRYSVRYSRYQRDVLADFAASCRQRGVHICYYWDPADAFDAQRGESGEQIAAKQLAWLTEILTDERYGPVHRIWLDSGSRATAYIALIRKLSPRTLTVPGKDGWLNGASGGLGQYPLFTSTNFTVDSGGQLQPHGWLANGVSFVVRETDLSIQMTSQGKDVAWFWENKHVYLSGRDLWDFYLSIVGRGGNLIINMPPNIYGGVPPKYRAEGKKLGDALRSSFNNPVASAEKTLSVCSGNDSILLALPPAAVGQWNAIVTKEDLANGQHVLSYTLDWSANLTSSVWNRIDAHGQTIGRMVVDGVGVEVSTKAIAIRFTCLRAVFSKFTLTKVTVVLGVYNLRYPA